jgi:hypothetical protein
MSDVVHPLAGACCLSVRCYVKAIYSYVTGSWRQPSERPCQTTMGAMLRHHKGTAPRSCHSGQLRLPSAQKSRYEHAWRIKGCKRSGNSRGAC